MNEILKKRFPGTRTSIKSVVYGATGLLIGYYCAGSFESVGNFIFTLLGSFFAFAIASQGIEKTVYERRGAADKGVYTFISVFVLFGACWFSAGIASAGVEPGDEDSFGNVATNYIAPKSCQEEKGLYLNMFFALIAPTVISVRSTVGSINKGFTTSD